MLATSLSSSCQCPVRLLGVYESSCEYSGSHQFSAVGPMILGSWIAITYNSALQADSMQSFFSSVWIVPIYDSSGS